MRQKHSFLGQKIKFYRRQSHSAAGRIYRAVLDGASSLVPLSLRERVRHCLTDRAPAFRWLRSLPMQRYELKDEHWALIEPVLPAQRRETPGGVWRDHRTVVNGIFWVLFSGGRVAGHA